MKKIKNIFSILTIFILFILPIYVSAATLSVTGSTSTTSTVVGNTFTVTFKYSSSNPLGAVVYSMSYDSDLLTLTSGTQSNALSYTGNDKSDSVKFTFKAKKSGTAEVTFKINEALDFDGNTLQASNVTKTITIKSQKEVEASYSKDNNLSSLTVNNGTLSPAFNKNTTDYQVEVENNVTSIIIDGKKEDSKSSVSGFKEYELDEGLNKLEVKVTAQNGSSKTYTINVTRKELSPIVVKVNNKELTLVRKKELLKSPNTNYEEVIIKIEDNEIPAFYNEATKTYLVGLKDSDGKIELYKYENENYSLYKEMSFNSLIITPTDLKNIPNGFKEEKITINDQEVTAYKNTEDEIIVSGVNIQSGQENLYKYDKNENTLQIYNSELLTKIDELYDDKTNYLYVIIFLGSLLIITYLVILFNTVKKEKNIKKRKKEKKVIEFNDNKKEEEDFADENLKLDEEEFKNLEESNDNDLKDTEIDLSDDNDESRFYTEELIELDDILHNNEKNNEILEDIEIISKKRDKIEENISKKRKKAKKK